MNHSVVTKIGSQDIGSHPEFITGIKGTDSANMTNQFLLGTGAMTTLEENADGSYKMTRDFTNFETYIKYKNPSLNNRGTYNFYRLELTSYNEPIQLSNAYIGLDNLYLCSPNFGSFSEDGTTLDLQGAAGVGYVGQSVTDETITLYENNQSSNAAAAYENWTIDKIAKLLWVTEVVSLSSDNVAQTTETTSVVATKYLYSVRTENGKKIQFQRIIDNLPGGN